MERGGTPPGAQSKHAGTGYSLPLSFSVGCPPTPSISSVAQVVCDDHGSRGFGFVHFETHEAAQQAIATMNGMLLNDRKV